MYILKDEENKVAACAKNYQTIVDAKIALDMQDGIIEETEEQIISNNGQLYLKSEWENYKNTKEYKQNKVKEEAEDEIRTLKSELLDEDYKIIKAVEANFKNETPPYNMEELLQTRENKRNRINELENILTSN